MDEFSRRSTIAAVHDRCKENGFNSDRAKTVIARYDTLADIANDVARVVWSLRWPRSGYEPSFEISFSEEYRDGRRAVSAGFYMHQNNNAFDFPFEYLFMNYDEIQTAEDILADEKARKDAEAASKRANDQRSRDIATLKRLRQEYPDV